MHCADNAPLRYPESIYKRLSFTHTNGGPPNFRSNLGNTDTSADKDTAVFRSPTLWTSPALATKLKTDAKNRQKEWQQVMKIYLYLDAKTYNLKRYASREEEY